jgi:hypothetical protein
MRTWTLLLGRPRSHRHYPLALRAAVWGHCATWLPARAKHPDRNKVRLVSSRPSD